MVFWSNELCYCKLVEAGTLKTVSCLHQTTENILHDRKYHFHEITTGFRRVSSEREILPDLPTHSVSGMCEPIPRGCVTGQNTYTFHIPHCEPEYLDMFLFSGFSHIMEICPHALRIKWVGRSDEIYKDFRIGETA